MEQTLQHKPLIAAAIRYTGNNIYDIGAFTKGALIVSCEDSKNVYYLKGEAPKKINKGDYVIKTPRGNLHVLPDLYSAEN